MPKKIDPLNRKQYGAVTAILTVSDRLAQVVDPRAGILEVKHDLGGQLETVAG